MVVTPDALDHQLVERLIVAMASVQVERAIKLTKVVIRWDGMLADECDPTGLQPPSNCGGRQFCRATDESRVQDPRS